MAGRKGNPVEVCCLVNPGGNRLGQFAWPGILQRRSIQVQKSEAECHADEVRIHAQGSERKPIRQTRVSAAATASCCSEPTRQPAAANALAAARTACAASSTWPSRSRLAGGTSSSWGFMPWNQAWTTDLESRSASNAAT